MRVWRSHRLLRHSSFFRSHSSWRQPLHRQLLAPSSSFHTVRCRSAPVSAAQSSDISTPPLSFTPPLDKTNPASWVNLIEPHLPTHFRRSSLGDSLELQPQPIQSSIDVLSYAILQARRQSNIDLLVYLALQEGRWGAMLWITQNIVENYDRSRIPWLQPDGFSTLDWPTDMTLEEITRLPFIYTNDSRHPLGHGESLQNIASSDHVHRSESARVAASLALGEIWQSLGSLVIEAAQREAVEKDMIMRMVLRILASLQQHQLIPEALYRSISNKDPSALQQPLIFHKISSEMFQSLSDVANDIQSGVTSPELDSIHALDSSPPGLLTSSVSRFGPELWLEFILWCCVHGQWTMEGSAIVAELKKINNPTRWSLVSWRDRNSAFPVPSHGTRTISAEVVVALIDGLVVTSKSRGKLGGRSVGSILDKISVLKRVLDRDYMSLGISTWDALISRFADSPGHFSLERNPHMMEIVLQLAETYGRELKSRNVASRATGNFESPKSSYIFDGSAAIVGLYHRTLHACIRSRDIDGALRIWGRLQLLTDENKERSLKEFIMKLRSMDTPTKPALYSASRRVMRHGLDTRALFPGVQFPAYFPEIPVTILADLLDLVRESGNLELGKWMIYSKDVDGPMIPEAIYANQAITPSLIRFAAETNDKDLLSKLNQAQTTKISGKTLVALCDNRIRNGNFSGALEILNMINEYSLHDWTAIDLTTLVKSLFLQIYGPRRDKDVNEPTPKRAAALLQRLLRGDLGQVWGTSFAQVDTIGGILSSLDSYMSSLCSNLVNYGTQHKIDLPTASFNALLEGITQVWGSQKGKEVYDDWCNDQMDRDVPDLLGFQGPPPAELVPTIAELFSVQESESQKSEATENSVRFQGGITPDIATIRIIIHAAMKEVHNTTTAPAPASGDQDESGRYDAISEGSPHEVMQWARGILRGVFGLSEGEVDYELHGYFSPDSHGGYAQDMYSRQTLQIWQAFTGPHREWAKLKDDELRQFAAAKSERQMVFDTESPQERFLIHTLAEDYGLVSEALGEELETTVKVSKTHPEPSVPLNRVDEILAASRRT